MTSSSFFEIELRQSGRLVGVVRAEEHELPATGAAVVPIESERHADLMVTRPPGATTRGAVRIGSELVLVLAPGVAQNRARVDSLRDRKCHLRGGRFSFDGRLVCVKHVLYRLERIRVLDRFVDTPARDAREPDRDA